MKNQQRVSWGILLFLFILTGGCIFLILKGMPRSDPRVDAPVEPRTGLEPIKARTLRVESLPVLWDTHELEEGNDEKNEDIRGLDPNRVLEGAILL